MKIDRKKLNRFDKQVKSTTNVSFIKLIDSYLKHRKKFNNFSMTIERNKLIGFHPSSIGYDCPRKMGFNLLYELGFMKKSVLEECNLSIVQNNADSQFTFDAGHIFHGLIQYSYLPDIENLDYSVENPVKDLYNKYWIAGTDDVEVVLQDNKKWIVDIKTSNFLSYNKIKSASDIDPGYLIQLNLYMYGRKIPRAILLYVNKNTNRPKMKEYFYSFDKDLISVFLKKAFYVKKWLLNLKEIDILPECKKLTGLYKTCPFSSVCFRIRESSKIYKLTKFKEKEIYLNKIKSRMKYDSN